jgi:ankyrin repeat protein
MKKRVILAGVLLALSVTTGSAQGKDFYALARSGTPRELQDAIDQGAIVDAPDANGDTMLMNAARENKSPVVIAVLINAGASMDDQDADGMTALMLAARYNENPRVISMLLRAGASGKIKSRQGETALDYAQVNENLHDTEIFRQLEVACR